MVIRLPVCQSSSKRCRGVLLGLAGCRVEVQKIRSGPFGLGTTRTLCAGFTRKIPTPKDTQILQVPRKEYLDEVAVGSEPSVNNMMASAVRALRACGEGGQCSVRREMGPIVPIIVSRDTAAISRPAADGYVL